MAHPSKIIRKEWLDWVKNNLTADFEQGLLYYKTTTHYRKAGVPLGSKNKKGYLQLNIGYEDCQVHQVIWFLYYGKWPSSLIDHKDRNPSNNSISNLELSDHSKNGMNSKIRCDNSSGFRGVSLSRGKYRAVKRNKHLGTFNTKEEAIDAYNKHS